MDIAEPQVFSPRARGCSEFRKSLYGDSLVFPACAGMFLDTKTNDAGHRSFPRVRGDVPKYLAALKIVQQFSPRARGCSESQPHQSASTGVFPACAGMFLPIKAPMATTTSFPRVRGDVPCPRATAGFLIRFSPRARGCSWCPV